MTVDTLNRARYVGADFDTLLDESLARAQVRFAADFNDFAVTGLGLMLLDLQAFGGDTLSFYSDRRVTEVYLATARTRKAVSRLTRQLGYKMGAATAASTDLQVTLTKAYPFDVPLYAGYAYKTPSGVIYEVAQTVVFTAGEVGPKTVSVYQGETVTETFTSDGSANQSFPLSRLPAGTFVVHASAQVTVAAAVWKEVEFIEFETTDQFEISYNDDPPTLRLGNGVAGNIPTAGSVLQVRYVATKGKLGKTTKNTITQPVTPLVVMATTIPQVVTNPLGTIGGDDPEDLDHAKSFAPKVWASRRAAITGGDYDALAGSFSDPFFGRVAVAKAFSARSAAEDLAAWSSMDTILAAVLPQAQALQNAITGTTDPVYTGALQNLDALDASVAEMSTLLAAVADSNATSDADLQSLITDARLVKDRAGEVTVDANQANTTATAVLATVNAIATGGSDQLQSATKTALVSQLTQIVAGSSAIQSASSQIQAGAESEIATAGQLRTRLAAVGVTPVAADSLLDQTNTVLSAMLQNTDATSGLRANLVLMQSLIVDTSSSVQEQITFLKGHLDEILSADCKANVVSVPILAVNSDGFYAPPSVGLVQSLQAYLTARKEVTQTVSVTSGEGFLVYPKIYIRIGVYVGFSQNTVKASVLSVVLSLLRKRVFGKGLYVAAVYKLVAKVNGVAFANVTIEGHYDTSWNVLDDLLDADGNLLIAAYQVITRASGLGDDIVIEADPQPVPLEDVA